MLETRDKYDQDYSERKKQLHQEKKQVAEERESMLKKLWESETELEKVRQVNTAILAEVETAVASGKSKASAALKETLRRYGGEMRMSEIGSVRNQEPDRFKEDLRAELEPVKEQECEITENTFNQREKELVEDSSTQQPLQMRQSEL